MTVVVYDSNNSGGVWWLSDEDWDALAEAGWAVHWCPKTQYDGDPLEPSEKNEAERWLGALATSAAKEFVNPRDAIAEFERVTGQDASAEGCNCCGSPHSFTYEDDDGKSHYARARVVATAIDFDS